MGAAASLKIFYRDGWHWFKEHFTNDIYVSYFRSIDKDRSGAISLDELRKWIAEKAELDSNWKFFSSNPLVFTIAHANASKVILNLVHGNVLEYQPETVVSIDQFRLFLVHLFVISILWVHFSNADHWVEGHDVGNNKLTFDEFRLAYRSLTSAQAQETLTEEQLIADFQLLDKNKDHFVTFQEICSYCVKFIDPDFAASFDTLVAKNRVAASADDDQTTGQCMGDEGFQSQVHHHRPIDLIIEETERNRTVARLESLKANTEMALEADIFRCEL